MPRQPIDYSKALIYKLCCKDTSIKETYIGSTTDFRHRKSCHKTACNNQTNKDHNNPKYKFIREHGGWENWDMVLVAYAPCKTKLELLKIEREYIENHEHPLNDCIPARSKEEKKAVAYAACKEYYANHKDMYKVRSAKYRAANKEKEDIRRVAYCAANKEKIANYKHGWYNSNREKLLAKQAEKVVCEHCRKEVTRGNFFRHQRSKTCLAAQAANEAN